VNAPEDLVEAVRAGRGLDPRTSVFDVRIAVGERGWVIEGETTEPEALAQLVRRAAAAGSAPVEQRVRLLPEPELGAALVRAAVAPLLAEPRLEAALLTQAVLGQPLTLLAARGDWLRARAEDGYIGWTHRGYLATGTAEWVRRWLEPVDGDPVLSLGAEIRDDAGRACGWLPWGARAVRETGGTLLLPDGRRAVPGPGELVPLRDRAATFPPRGERLVESARRWLGAPYLWGGNTPAGTDCSGLVHAVYRLHGVALPRDSDQQARAGHPVEPGPGFAALRPGDLVFFAERPGRVTHVAIALGGPRILHASLSNGEVAENDLAGASELERRLRSCFVGARRVLPG